MKEEVFIIPAIWDDRYFIFRENGQEVEFTIKENSIRASQPLTKEESIFIYENIK
ncbi:hypothetical protein [Aquimarina algiphila]|uniref:hypothetical protein n=1 Tax=Aquimarina algiphila TaxID=2047982 RepID=UPI0014318C5F|nr:hypothetical protein [Aquimarina algiphila]